MFVSVAIRDGEPVLVDRRRVKLLEPGLPNQPYHHETLSLDNAHAEELANKVRASALHCCERELAKLRSSLEAAREVVAIALREPTLPNFPESVAAAHASYTVTVRADGMIYHDALCRAAAAMGLGVETIARGEECRRAAETLRRETERVDAWLLNLRGSLGPPWQKDHRDAAARAVVALGRYAAVRLGDVGVSRPVSSHRNL